MPRSQMLTRKSTLAFILNRQMVPRKEGESGRYGKARAVLEYGEAYESALKAKAQRQRHIKDIY